MIGFCLERGCCCKGKEIMMGKMIFYFLMLRVVEILILVIMVEYFLWLYFVLGLKKKFNIGILFIYVIFKEFLYIYDIYLEYIF